MRRTLALLVLLPALAPAWSGLTSPALAQAAASGTAPRRGRGPGRHVLGRPAPGATSSRSAAPSGEERGAQSITRAQFVQRAAEAAGRRFDAMDTTHAGVLTRAQMRAWRQAHHGRGGRRGRDGQNGKAGQNGEPGQDG